jgi:chaperonin GroES
MPLQFRPLADRVIVKKVEKSEITPGGIIIPKTVGDHEQAWQGEVISVGPGKKLDNGTVVEPGVKTGDIVVIGKYLGNEIKIEGEDYIIVQGDDILGVVED